MDEHTIERLNQQIAGDLRDLPRQSFKNRLRLEIEKEAFMLATGVNPIPAGYRTITAYVTVPGVDELIAWIKQAVLAEEVFRTTGSAGGTHAELRIGDSMLMVGGGSKTVKAAPTAFHVMTDDVDATYARAMAAGAVSMAEPADQPYGERVAGVKDPAGNEWYFGKVIGGSAIHASLGSLTVYLHPAGATRMIEFLQEAFAAEAVQVFSSADGVVQHAKVLIGDSILEMGEAHGIFQPMPTQFYLYVPDCDAWYTRAVAAGAKGIRPPHDQPYGDRYGEVQDPFGNTWWIATHVRDV